MFSANSSQVSNDANYIEDVFSTYLYTGNGSTQTITNGIDLSTKGGMTWLKCRSAVGNNFVFDTTRGAGNYLRTNLTNANFSDATTLSAFNSNGFSLGSNAIVNTNAATYASWTFRKQPKFFDVVTYTGNGTSQNIAHSLGAVPGSIFVKKTSGVDNWGVYHRSIGNTKHLRLNTTDAEVATTLWNNTDPTSTQFSVSGNYTNESGFTYVAYLFAHNAGGFGLTGTDNVISCGSFTTNASNQFSQVSLGYEPQWILYKNTTGPANWNIFDNMRGFSVDNATANNDAGLYPNTSGAEVLDSAIQPNATGFISTATNSLSASSTYIYIAIRRGPMKVPTSGTSVFAIDQGDGVTNPQFYAPFPQDSAIYRSVSVASNWAWFDRLRGQKNRLITNLTDAEGTFNVNMFDDMNRWFRGTTSTAYYSWMFRRAPSFFDEVCYTGNSTAGATQSHNLGVVPELIIVKRRDFTYGWYTYVASLGNTKYLQIDSTNGSLTQTFWNNTTPTASVFSLGSNNQVNQTAGTYVAYLFATCAGVSKVGSYTGNGSSQTINCGFTSGARFILIKRTDAASPWYVWDTARGIVAGNDPYLLLNSSVAEVQGYDDVDTASTGFIVNYYVGGATDINTSGGTYIYLAIA